MALDTDQLLALLDEGGYGARTMRHPPLHTVAESKALRGMIDGVHTKNLFLKDRKDNFFLVSVDEDAVVDLKTIHQLIGASGKVSFGSAEKLAEFLGVVPGAVTLLGAVNDTEGRVSVVIDEALMAGPVVNAHPLTNEATTSIAPAELIRFLRTTGHEPAILKIAG